MGRHYSISFSNRESRCKMRKKIVLLGVLCGVVFLGGCNKKEERKEDVVIAYIDELMSEDFSYADSYVGGTAFKITSFEYSTQAFLNNISKEIYYELYHQVIENIDSIEVLGVEKEEITNYEVYQIRVTMGNIVRRGELSIDKEKVNSLLEGYINGEYNRSSVEEKLKSLYIAEFKKCFERGDGVKIIETQLKSDGENVYYTEEFIKSLIPEEMKKNIELYEKNITAKFKASIVDFQKE